MYSTICPIVFYTKTNPFEKKLKKKKKKKVKELSNKKRQMGTKNTYTVKHTTNYCWVNNQKVSNTWNSCKPARKRTQVHVVPKHSEEDGEGVKEEPKDHSSRTADFS